MQTIIKTLHYNIQYHFIVAIPCNILFVVCSLLVTGFLQNHQESGIAVGTDSIIDYCALSVVSPLLLDVWWAQ